MPASWMRTASAAAFVATLVLGAGAALARVPGHPSAADSFPPQTSEFFLSGKQGNATGALALEPIVPGTAGRITFLVPGVDVLDVVKTPASQDWLASDSWDKDREVLTPSQVEIYFSANAQALAVFEVRLFDHSAGGDPILLASDQQQFVTALSPTPVHFYLHTEGQVLDKGHHLLLQVYAQTLNAAVFLDYGGASPSGIHQLDSRWLDSDGDGIADSDERVIGTNPLDPQSPALDDADHDGLADGYEATIGTDAHKADTDGDGFSDGIEVQAGTNPLDATSKPYDGNGNGLPDVYENRYFNSTTIQNGIDPYADQDDDGCNNLCEAAHGTDPNNPDTDGDGILDGADGQNGASPQGSGNVLVSGPRGVPEPVAAAAAFAIASTLVLVSLLRRSPA